MFKQQIRMNKTHKDTFIILLHISIGKLADSQRNCLVERWMLFKNMFLSQVIGTRYTHFFDTQYYYFLRSEKSPIVGQNYLLTC